MTSRSEVLVMANSQTVALRLSNSSPGVVPEGSFGSILSPLPTSRPWGTAGPQTPAASNHCPGQLPQPSPTPIATLIMPSCGGTRTAGQAPG